MHMCVITARFYFTSDVHTHTSRSWVIRTHLCLDVSAVSAVYAVLYQKCAIVCIHDLERMPSLLNLNLIKYVE